MPRLIDSKACAWGALALIVFLIIIAYPMRTAWWQFIDLFFAFMMVFCHLMALNVRRISAHASRTLDISAFVCGILMVIAFIVEAILM